MNICQEWCYYQIWFSLLERRLILIWSENQKLSWRPAYPNLWGIDDLDLSRCSFIKSSTSNLCLVLIHSLIRPLGPQRTLIYLYKLVPIPQSDINLMLMVVMGAVVCLLLIWTAQDFLNTSPRHGWASFAVNIRKCPAAAWILPALKLELDFQHRCILTTMTNPCFIGHKAVTEQAERISQKP